MPAVLAETTRSGMVESIHHGVVAVANPVGEIVASAGDVHQMIFYRSSAKPFQAIPVVASGAADRFGLTDRELALCCASHSGQPHHQAEVRGLLAKIGLGPEALQCGSIVPYNEAEGARVRAGLQGKSALMCDCSGKHSGMLAVCVHEGLPIETYMDINHPLQQRILRIMAQVLRVAVADIAPGIDGCSLPTFGASVAACAKSWAALAAPDAVPAGFGREHAAALKRLRKAMVSAPENVAGDGELVTDMMQLAGPRLYAKSGAEGLICFALPEQQLGVAIRVLDGSFRTHPVVVAAVLRQLQALDEATIAAITARHPSELRNHNRRLVGEIRATVQLRGAAVA